MNKKILALLMVMALLLGLLTGCSSSSDKQGESATLQVVVLAPYVFEENAKTLEDTLNAQLPHLTTETASMTMTCISAGNSETDPYGTMAAMTRMAGMLSSNEIDLLICDETNARRYAENGEVFIPLSELFTQEEMEEAGIVAAYVALLDDEGNPTGEMSEACGVDLSGCTTLKELLLISDLNAYVITDSANVENAKDVILYLVSME